MQHTKVIRRIIITSAYTNPYFTSLYAAYISTYLCGVCIEHLTYSNNVHPIVTSIMQYHVFRLMSIFLKNPDKMKRYLNSNIHTIVNKHRPRRDVTERKWEQSKILWKLFRTRMSKAGKRTKNHKLEYSNYGGQLGFHYDLVVGTTYVSLEDYKVFLAPESNGFARLGERLIQESIQSYIYCVLGSQAQTKTAIIGKGALSLQTRDIFRKLVKESLVQNETFNLIKNVQLAIKSTNVIPNIAISPDMQLVPDNLIILNNPKYAYKDLVHNTIIKECILG